MARLKLKQPLNFKTYSILPDDPRRCNFFCLVETANGTWAFAAADFTPFCPDEVPELNMPDDGFATIDDAVNSVPLEPGQTVQAD